VIRVLTTKHLALRHATIADDQFIVELFNDPAFLRNIGDRGVRTLADAQRFLRDGPIASYEKLGYGMYVVEPKEGGPPMGVSGFVKRDWLPNVDLGCAFLPRYRFGFAFESLQAVVTYGRDVLGQKRLLGLTHPENTEIISICKKLGMRFDGNIRAPDEDADMNLYVLDL
jgi:RimJ/RimL family protein N-acetyltransferase